MSEDYEDYEYYRGLYNGLVYRIDKLDFVEIYTGLEYGWRMSQGTADCVRNGKLWARLDYEPMDIDSA